jgi:hypothetical protein
MNPPTITIPLSILPPDCARPGHKLELTGVAQIESVEGDHAQIRLSAINSHSLDDTAPADATEPDEAAMRQLAQADDDANWQD